MSEKKDTVQSAEEFLKDTQQAYRELRTSLNKTLEINGKTMGEWFRIFHNIKIPEDATASHAKKIATDLMVLEQKAAQSLIAANARTSVIDQIENKAYQDQYDEMVAQYKVEGTKLPAAAHLDTMAKIATRDARWSGIMAQLERQFWRDIITYLTRMRKKLERIDMNNSFELKYMKDYPEVSNDYINDDDEEDGEF